MKSVKDNLLAFSTSTAEYINKCGDILGQLPQDLQEQIIHPLKVLKFYKHQIDTMLATMKVETKPASDVQVSLPNNVLPFVAKKNLNNIVRGANGKRALELE